jgi:hypothetical protein
MFLCRKAKTRIANIIFKNEFNSILVMSYASIKDPSTAENDFDYLGAWFFLCRNGSSTLFVESQKETSC